MPDNIMMIGPSLAGKTTLLSVLRLASAGKLKNEKKVRIRPLNDDAKQLFERARDIVDSGSIIHAPNAMATRYEFELICDIEKRVKVVEYKEELGMFPWSKPTRVEVIRYEQVKEPKSFTLHVLDGKGGDIFGSRQPRRTPASTTVWCGDGRDGLPVLRVDRVRQIPNDPENTKLFFTGLQRFLDEVNGSGVGTPFARVVIALTQADRTVEKFGSSAQMKLEEMDPADVASKTLGRYAKNDLFEALGSAASKQVYAGWVSVYGFIPNEGSVNFDSVNDRIAIFRADDASWLDTLAASRGDRAVPVRLHRRGHRPPARSGTPGLNPLDRDSPGSMSRFGGPAHSIPTPLHKLGRGAPEGHPTRPRTSCELRRP